MIIALITILGIPLGLSVYLLIQIIKDPNKIDKYIAIVSNPIYKITKWWSKKYIGAKVSYQITEFFNRHIIRNISNHPEVKININWVINEEDPVLREDNTVIICLKKDKDQARNILKAAETIIPIITYSNLRSNIKKHVAKSIDLVSLRNLAKRLGNHGKYAYKRYFLDPQTEQDERVAILFQKLVEIDNRGYFVPILLNELEYIGEGLFAEGDSIDHTNEIIEFIKYLIHIARIEVGDEVKQWSYFSKVFNAGIILLANDEKMIKQGVKPYIERITKNLKQGHESIYILAEENSWDFLKRYEKVISENDRVLIKGRYHVDGIVENDPRRVSKVEIILLRKIDIYVDDLFKEKISASNIKIGEKFEGEVIDIYEENAIVTIMGIDAFIKKNECSWYKIQSCSEILKLGEKRDFIVKAIDEVKLSIEITLRFDSNDPWNKLPRPKISDKLQVKVLSKNNVDFFTRDINNHEILIPITELSWFGCTEIDKEALVGRTIDVLIFELNEVNKLIKASIRRLENDPWPEINERIRPGSEFIGKVTEVNSHFIRVDIKDGLNGIIPKERLFEAGGIYADYKSNIVLGQGIEVIVTKVFISKRKIHLNLKK